MKQRWIALALALCLCVGLLPLQAEASQDVYGEYECRDYETLVTALADPNATSITIRGRWETIIDSGDYSYFEWPTEEVTLNFDRASYCSVYIYEDWTIPENVTVYMYDDAYAPGNTITVNGDWYMMSNNGFIRGLGHQSPSIVFNGDVYANAQNGSFIYADEYVFNGNLYINAGSVSIANMVLGDGAQVTGQDFEVWSYLRGPASGSATVKCGINARYYSIFENSSETVTFFGNLNLANIRVTYTHLVFAAGSHISVGQIYGDPNYTIAVNGELTLARDKYQSFGDTAVTINESGALIMLPGVQLGGSGSTGSLSGTGTLKLYAEVNQFNNYTSHPSLYGQSTGYQILNVADTVTIWKNWTDACQTHAWDDGVVVPATCASYGNTTYTCTREDCGTVKIIEDWENDYSEIHGEGNLTYYTSGKGIYHKCLLCNGRAGVNLTAKNGVYNNGEPVTGVEVVTYDSGWQGGEVSIKYASNVEPGEETATVYMTLKGLTVSDTFSIYEGNCAHDSTGGSEATCSSGAICGICGQEFGSKLKHKYVTDYDKDGHWSFCRVCGEEQTDSREPHNYSSYASEELGYEDASMSYCRECYYGYVSSYVEVVNGVANITVESVAVGDVYLAAQYDENGKYLGMDQKVIEENGYTVLEVPVEEDSVMIKVFNTDKDWRADHGAKTLTLP